MAANKFATMLHRNTHKIIVILVYTFLEWILIFLLFFNSIFSFLISKFADYFGLKPPCLWCSRVDHILEPNKKRNSYRDLLCEAHAAEISHLGYCPNHHKLAEAQNLCKDCLSTQPKYNEKSIEISRRIGFFKWVSENSVQNGEENLKCSCCDESLSSKFYPSFLIFKPSLGELGYKLKADLNAEAMGDENSEEEGDDCSRSVSNLQCCKRVENEDASLVRTGESGSSFEDYVYQSSGEANCVKICFIEDESFNIMNIPPQFSTSCGDSDRLIPIELIDSSTIESQISCESRVEDPRRKIDHLNGSSYSEPQINEQVKLVEEATTHAVSKVAKKTRYGLLERLEIGELVNSSILMDEEGIQDLLVAVADVVQTPSTDGSNVHAATTQESVDLQGMEVSGHDLSYESETKEPIPSSLPYAQADQPCMDKKVGALSGPDISVINNINQGSKQIQKAASQMLTNLAGKDSEGISHHLAANLELSEVEKEKILLFEKREAGTEESWDGSVISEMEGEDGAALTIEKLKSAVRVERKALSALYAELEQERNAAAIAANQTMAMITRLQEEKAAMQMEALQYQRMMEEQSEYDQEALQLLNELMMKREKEKQELEKELELYRKKVFDYEAKEKMAMMRRRDGSVRSRNSSACGNAEDTDELSIDLNRDGRDEDNGFYEHQEVSNNGTPIDAALNLDEIGLYPVKHLSALDESLVEFEEARLSILEELKALEEKLFTLADEEEEQLFEDVKPTGQFADHSKDDDKYGFSSPEENEVSNGFSGNSNGDHYPEENNIMHYKAKKLLPLFDATSIVNEDGELNEERIESDPSRIHNSSDSKFEPLNKKLEEEVDHVYERLQALETDREFLKHCISSLKKGDKGMELLQEILQHLRDLRTVELRARNICDSPLL